MTVLSSCAGFQNRADETLSRFVRAVFSKRQLTLSHAEISYFSVFHGFSPKAALKLCRFLSGGCRVEKTCVQGRRPLTIRLELGILIKENSGGASVPPALWQNSPVLHRACFFYAKRVFPCARRGALLKTFAAGGSRHGKQEVPAHGNYDYGSIAVCRGK